MPALGLKEIDTVVVWMTNLNAIVSPMCFLWVFVAFMFLYRHWDKFKGAEYKYISNKTLGFLMGLWGFAFTAFGMYSRNGATNRLCANPSEWWFVLISNIIMPFALLGLGLVLPWIARREQKQQA